jgi:hypothetical protein
VRFVDGEQGQLAGFVERVEHGQRAFEQQALGGDVDEVEVAAEDGLLDLLRFPPVERRVEDGGLDAELGQRVDLVLHQRDQRRDDDGAAGAEQGGNLVAEALAAAGRHQHQRIAAAGDVVDDFGLRAAEGGVAEDVAQDLQGCCCGRHRFRAGLRGGRLRGSALAVPDQVFAAVLVPVGEHPALDMDAIDDVVVRGWLVGVAMDEGGVAVIAQEVVGGGRLQVGRTDCPCALLAANAAPTHPAAEAAQETRPGEHFLLPGRAAHTARGKLVGGIVEAQSASPCERTKFHSGSTRSKGSASRRAPVAAAKPGRAGNRGCRA